MHYAIGKIKIVSDWQPEKTVRTDRWLNATCIQRHHSKLGCSKTLQLEAICWNKRTNRVHYQHAKIEEIFGFQVQQKRTQAGSQLKKIKQWKGIRSFRLNATMVFHSENEKSP